MINDTPTEPELPAVNDTERPPPSVPLPLIVAGGAQIAMSSALDRLVDAVRVAEETAMALARALDATSTK
jgi:hypothetical protein